MYGWGGGSHIRVVQFLHHMDFSDGYTLQNELGDAVSGFDYVLINRANSACAAATNRDVSDVEAAGGGGLLSKLFSEWLNSMTPTAPR